MPSDTSPFATADICDQNEQRSITVVGPILHNFGGKIAFAGSIATVRCAEDNSKVRKQLQAPGNGRVLVVDGAASMRCALLGGNLATMAAANDWRGIVVNGCVRDCVELQQAAIGIRALAAHPRRSEKRQSGEINVSVYFADALFVPGHFLYADNDGIVLSTKPL